MSEFIDVSLNNNILKAKINRPEKKNALTIDMYQCLAETLESAEENNNVRVITIEGTGDSFTAGNDLNDFLVKPPVDSSSPVFMFMRALVKSQKPLMAIVNGSAIGIGTTMLLHCDIVYAIENAKFQLPFINLGLVPELGSSLLLPQTMGHCQASELLMLGESFDSNKAKRIGLINDYFNAEQLHERADIIAKKLALKPPGAMLHTKKLMKQENEKILKKIEEESYLFSQQLKGPEVKEAISAFFEKREPNFMKI